MASSNLWIPNPFVSQRGVIAQIPNHLGREEGPKVSKVHATCSVVDGSKGDARLRRTSYMLGEG